MEEIESFLLDKNSRALPFYIELTGITYSDPGYEIYRECSEIYVLEYVISGKGVVNINDEHFTVNAGDVYLLPIGTRCHYYADKESPYTKIWMNVNGELCQKLLQVYKLDHKYHFKNVNLYPLFIDFQKVCKDKSLPNDEIFETCSRIFFKMIQTLYSSCHRDASINEYVLKAKYFCDMNIYEKISVTDVAYAVNLSVSQINRLFKREFGITIYSYLLNCRIETAKSLLKGTAMTISQISDKLNFVDEHYFSNIFKKKTSLSPSEYRKSQKG